MCGRLRDLEVQPLDLTGLRPFGCGGRPHTIGWPELTTAAALLQDVERERSVLGALRDVEPMFLARNTARSGALLGLLFRLGVLHCRWWRHIGGGGSAPPLR